MGVTVTLALALALTACGHTSSSTGGADSSAGAKEGPPTDLAPETWQTDDGTVTMLHSEAAHLSVSQGCQKPDGKLDCDAYRFVTSPPHVDMSGGNAHGASQGTLRCTRAHHTLVTAHDTGGNQDGFCKFADGSYTTTGSIESRPNP